MSDNDFYITLESNGDIANHPENTQNKFKITLQTPIDLKGEWETGLAQIIFPHSWHEKIMRNNHPHSIFSIKLHTPGDGKDDPVASTYWRKLDLEPKNYHTIKDLVMAIRNTVEFSKRNMVQFIYRGSVGGAVDTDFLRINVVDGALLAINITLAKILSYDVDMIRREKWTEGVSIQKEYVGYGPEWLIIKPVHQKAVDAAQRQFLPSPLSENIQIKVSEADKEIGIFQNIYINSDLIQTQFVGNTRANVLRILAPVKKKGQVETFNFSPIFYFPLRIIKFNTIEINITGDTGTLVPFDGGVVVVVLHLRRKHHTLV